MTAASAPLRSARWFAGHDDVAVMHRVALRNVGIEIDPADPRPVIGIADSSSPVNPCNLPLRALAEEVARGVTEAGGIPLTLPVMSLGEDLMKPTAMLYRNLLSMEVEEYARAYPLDGLVLLGNCDKSIPGALMGAVSADLPTLVVNAGARPAGVFRGRRVGTGTDLWRAWEDRRAGALDDAAWAAFETALSCGPGACNTLGTASSMAIVAEVLGFVLPGTSTIPAADPRRSLAAIASGREAVAAVRAGRTPSRMLTPAAVRNAIVALNAAGGSTNVVLHLIAIAGRTGLPLPLGLFDELARRTPVLADVEPSGGLLMQDFDAAGGVPALLHALGDLIDTEAATAAGTPWSAAVAPARRVGDELPIRQPGDAIASGGAFAVLTGTLAPRGALVKVSAATPDLLRHRGRALVFRSYPEMIERLDDPDLEVDASTVLVLAGAGPKGAPGMPEWGVIPLPRRLAEQGVRDMVRISDARMSGTAFGTCIVHVTPEAADGGPLGLVRTGDVIVVDLPSRRLDLDVDDAELERRRAEPQPVPAASSVHLRGWPLLYREHVLQADAGCDFDFLVPAGPEARTPVQPEIGRS
ncbi:dihydroxy-acid dehydratase [Leifsonia aquatica]|uniref:dihydroxy-acid dehydratase n=1 Tax=Leifsonia aquatica TaxID=144185 RepID=UPI0004692696|nr:dihydroxy-acid dehydratase [Leifsonia aquatica]